MARSSFGESLFFFPSVNLIVNKPRTSNLLKALKYEWMTKDHQITKGKSVAQKTETKMKEVVGASQLAKKKETMETK